MKFKRSRRVLAEPMVQLPQCDFVERQVHVWCVLAIYYHDLIACLAYGYSEARRKNIKFEFKRPRRVQAKPMAPLVQCDIVERQVRVSCVLAICFENIALGL